MEVPSGQGLLGIFVLGPLDRRTTCASPSSEPGEYEKLLKEVPALDVECLGRPAPPTITAHSGIYVVTTGGRGRCDLITVVTIRGQGKCSPDQRVHEGS